MIQITQRLEFDMDYLSPNYFIDVLETVTGIISDWNKKGYALTNIETGKSYVRKPTVYYIDLMALKKD